MNSQRGKNRTDFYLLKIGAFFLMGNAPYTYMSNYTKLIFYIIEGRIFLGDRHTYPLNRKNQIEINQDESLSMF